MTIIKQAPTADNVVDFEELKEQLKVPEMEDKVKKTIQENAGFFSTMSAKKEPDGITFNYDIDEVKKFAEKAKEKVYQ